MMKRVLLTMMLFSILLTLSGCYQYSFQESREFTLDYEEHMELYLTNRVGNITVEEWDNDEVSIVVNLTGRANSESLAENMVHKAIIDVNPIEMGVEIEGRGEERSDASLRMDYQIKIPSAFNCTINTSVGDIHLKKVEGDVYLSSGTGSITIDYLQGDLQVRGGTGDIRLGIMEGDLNVSTSTGDIQVDYVYGEVAQLETSTGSIVSTLEIPEETENRIKSSTGDITLYLRGEISTHLWADVGTGKIELDGLDLLLEQMEERRVVGILGRGESRLTVQTSTGDIRIIRD